MLRLLLGICIAYNLFSKNVISGSWGGTNTYIVKIESSLYTSLVTYSKCAIGGISAGYIYIYIYIYLYIYTLKQLVKYYSYV